MGLPSPRTGLCGPTRADGYPDYVASRELRRSSALFGSTKRLLLGFVDRVDHGLLNGIEQVMGWRAEPCFITRAGFDEQMARVSVAPDYGELVVDAHQLPEQMAKTAAGLAVEVNASEASSGTRNYVWTRLTGKRRKIDVLFQARHSAPKLRRTKFF